MLIRAWHALLVRLGVRPRVTWEIFAWCREVDRLLAIERRRPLTYRERRRLELLRGHDDRAVDVDGASLT